MGSKQKLPLPVFCFIDRLFLRRFRCLKSLGPLRRVGAVKQLALFPNRLGTVGLQALLGLFDAAASGSGKGVMVLPEKS